MTPSQTAINELSGIARAFALALVVGAGLVIGATMAARMVKGSDAKPDRVVISFPANRGLQ